jgi:hypothetical protein
MIEIQMRLPTLDYPNEVLTGRSKCGLMGVWGKTMERGNR